MLTELEWWVLEVGEEVLRPLMLAMMTLEGQNYVTGSLVIPMVESIRKGLHAAHDRLVELGDSIGPQVSAKGEDFHMQGILEAMIDDFDSRWGDGTDINKYTLGTNGTNKGQPCGYLKLTKTKKRLCGVFWRSDARSSCRMMRRSGSSLFILLNPTHCC